MFRGIMEESTSSNINMHENQAPDMFTQSPGMAKEEKSNWQSIEDTQTFMDEHIDKSENAFQKNGQNFKIEYRKFNDLPSLPENINKEELVDGIKERFQSENWIKINEALDQLRCINKQYPCDMNEACRIFWPFIVTAINNLRSAVSKNSLLFVKELFLQSKGYKIYDEIIFGLVPVVLSKCFSEKRFLQSEAQKACDALVENCVYDSTLLSFCKGCFHKNFQVKELSVKALCKMIENFGENISKLQNATFRDLFLTLAKVSLINLKFFFLDFKR